MSDEKYSHTYNGDNVVQTIATSLLIQSSSITGNQDSHKISEEFYFQPHQTIHVRGTCPWVLKKPIFDLVIDSAFNFDRLFIKLAGNQDSHKFLDEFELRPDQTFHLGVTCPREPKKPIFDLVRSIVPSILTGSSSNLQVARTAINSRMSLNFG